MRDDQSLRTSESTSAIRHEMITEETVRPYFQNLKAELDRRKYSQQGQSYLKFERDMHNICYQFRQNRCRVKKSHETPF